MTVHAAIDAPADGSGVAAGPVRIVGWALDESGPLGGFESDIELRAAEDGELRVALAVRPAGEVQGSAIAAGSWRSTDPRRATIGGCGGTVEAYQAFLLRFLRDGAVRRGRRVHRR